MNCPNCNTPLGENDVFCLNCGQKIVKEEAPQEVPVQAPQSAAPVVNEPDQYAAPNAYNNPNPQYSAPNAYNNPNPQYAPPAAPKTKTDPLEVVKNLFTTVTTNIMNFVNSNEKVRKILFKEDGKINVVVPAAAGGVVVVLLAIIIIASASGSPKSVAKDYLKAAAEGDVYTVLENETIDNDAVKKFLKDLGKQEDLTEKDVYEKIASNVDDSDADFTNYKGLVKYATEKTMEEEKEWLEDVYGDDYKIKIEVESAEKCTKSRSEDYRDELDYMIRDMEEEMDGDLGFDADDAKKFVEVDYTVIIDGSEDRDRERGTLVLAKIKGDWKVFPDSDYGLDPLFNVVNIY